MEQVEAKAQAAPKGDETGVESQFEQYLREIIHDWLKTLCILGFTLVPLFYVLDYVIIPDDYAEKLPQFGIYRLIVTVLVVLQYVILRKTRPSALGPLHGYFFTILVGGVIALMTTELGGFGSGYYAGINLVMIAVNLLLPWKAIHSAINGVISILMYLGINLLAVYYFPNSSLPAEISIESLISNLYFMGGTAIIATSINFVRLKLVKKEFLLRNELAESNESLERSKIELQKARDALWGEMEIAKRIQTALLPELSSLGAYEIAASMLPADEVGGDYYDIIDTGQTKWMIIGDVSGHGVESGLIMMMTQTSIYTTVTNDPHLPPSQVLTAANTVIRENISRLGANRYMTISCIQIENNRLTVAGKHQDIMIYRAATKTTEAIPTTGTWIGVLDNVAPFLKDFHIDVFDNDILLFFTDGVTEAEDENGEMFGNERLLECLHKYGHLPVDQILSNILRDVTVYQTHQDDDITLVIMRRVPAV